MEKPIISAVVPDTSQSKVTVSGVPDNPGVAAAIFRPLADSGVNVDMIVQNTSDEGVTDISFTLPTEQMEIGKEIMTSVASEIGAGEVSTDDSVGRVSVIGAGMASNPGVAATIFETLSSESINIHMISTSAIRVSCVVNKADIEKATNILHHAFELDKG